MSEENKSLLLADLPKYEESPLLLKPVYDPSANKIYYQTDPFVRDGEVVVKRIAEIPVKVEKVGTLAEEYQMSTNYGVDEEK